MRDHGFRAGRSGRAAIRESGHCAAAGRSNGAWKPRNGDLMPLHALFTPALLTRLFGASPGALCKTRRRPHRS